MSKRMRTILIGIVGTFLIYLASAFISLEFNLLEWTYFGRAMFVTVITAVFFLAWMGEDI